MLVAARYRKSALFGVLAHGARVDDDDIGVLFGRNGRVTHFREHAHDALAVRFVLLAAVRDDAGVAALADGNVARDLFAYDLYKFALTRGVRAIKCYRRHFFLFLIYILSQFTLYNKKSRQSRRDFQLLNAYFTVSYPFGLFFCQFQVSRHISTRFFSARQPRTSSAFFGFA